MNVKFDFHPGNDPHTRDGTVQTVLVTDCPPAMYRDLQDAAAGQFDDEHYFSIECKPEGASFGTWMFRATRISNVREA